MFTYKLELGITENSDDKVRHVWRRGREEEGIQAGMFLAASLLKQPSTPTPVAATIFSYTDEDET